MDSYLFIRVLNSDLVSSDLETSRYELFAYF